MLENQILKYLYDNYPSALFFSFVLGLLQISVVLDESNQFKLIVWIVCLLATLLIRSVDYYIYKYVYHEEIYSIYKMFSRFRWGVVLTGAVWGSFPVLLISSADITDMAFIAIVFGGISAGATTSMGMDKTSHNIYLLTTLVPLFLCWFYLGDFRSVVMGVMAVLFMFYLMMSGGRFRSQMRTNIELREAAIENEKALVYRQNLSELIVRVQSDSMEGAVSKTLFEEVLKEVIELSDSEFGFILKIDGLTETDVSSSLLVNQENIELKNILGEGIKLDELNLRKHRLESIYAELVVSGKIQSSDHLEIFQESPRRLLISSFFAIPLLREGKVVAVIGLLHSRKRILKSSITFLAPLFQTLERLFAEPFENE